MRVYIPATPAALADCQRPGWSPPLAYAVTDQLMKISSHDDGEMLDEEARDAAALASVVDLRSPRRVVVVADVSRSQATPVVGGHPAAVDLSGSVTPDTVVCAFVDEPEAADEGTAAVTGDQAALDRLWQRDLLWYDVSELPYIP